MPNTKSKSLFLAFCILIFSSYTDNSIILVTKGESVYKIVCSSTSIDDFQAAVIFQKYIKQITNVQLEISSDTLKESDFEILVGRSNRTTTLNFSALKPDGFIIKTIGKKLFIAGAGDKGTIYGVYHFIEKYLGCRMYSSVLTLIPKQTNIKLSTLNDIQNPAFNFRSVYYPDPENNEEYLDWHRLNRIERKWGLWGHTFHTLVPPDKYFGSHPEYFAEVGGKRQATQLCLTNQDVLKLLILSLGDKINDDNKKEYWSVSQNDGAGYCQCTNCKKLNDKYNSPQGSILSFVNQVAARFPDKTITTMAYSYSRQPPKDLKPAPNVMILLSVIESNRAKPIIADSRSESFRTDLSNWTRLTKNIIIWDYVVQFTNYISPFPNLAVLKPNISYFSSANINGVFEQGSIEVQGEFSELKSYLLAKLLWNPGANVMGIQKEFLNNYYGRASADVANYIKLIQQKVKDTNARLDIYGNPINSHKTYLSPDFIIQSKRIINNALVQVKDKPIHYKNVLKLKAGLDYSAFQQAKYFGIEKYGAFVVEGRNWKVRTNLDTEFKHFISTLKLLNITQLDESGTTPKQFEDQWNEMVKTGPKIHKAIRKPVKSLTDFYRDYTTKGINALVDGAPGYKDLSFNWVEWPGNDMVVVVDMEDVVKIDKISVSFLEHQRHLMFLPTSVLFETSLDGKKYEKVGEEINGQPKENDEIIVKDNEVKRINNKARYIKISAKNLTQVPSWYRGKIGRPSILADEIMIN